jgi:hypothetical protein
MFAKHYKTRLKKKKKGISKILLRHCRLRAMEFIHA